MGCCQSIMSKSSIAPMKLSANKPTGNASEPEKMPSFIRSSMASIVSAVAFNFSQFEVNSPLELTDKQKLILREHWKKTLLAQRPDLFHKIMLFSLQQSPKMNEVIACQQYCVRDLTKWTKLDRMSRGVREFFDRQINVNNLESALISKEARDLGAIHAKYAQFGFKPAFLDIWQQNALVLAEKLKFEDETEKVLFIEAWRILIAFTAAYMMIGYDASMQVVRFEKKKESLIGKTTDATLQDSPTPTGN